MICAGSCLHMYIYCVFQLDCYLSNKQADAYVIVYSVEDRESFSGAIDRLYEIRKEDGRSVAVILLANKADLVRTRVVAEEGTSPAFSHISMGKCRVELEWNYVFLALTHRYAKVRFTTSWSEQQIWSEKLRFVDKHVQFQEPTLLESNWLIHETIFRTMS